jgi:hypothetical protein
MQTRIPSYALALCLLLGTPQHACPDVSFSGQIIISQGVADGPGFVVAADMDGDEDLDVLVASRNDDTIAWHENIDGTGAFGPEQVITSATDLPAVALAADLDGDQDVDLVVACWESNRVSWYENDGAGGFGSESVVTASVLNVLCVFAADLDGDDDMDVLSASSDDDKVAWYKSEAITAIFEEADSHECASHLEQNRPNPFRSPTTIRFTLSRPTEATLTIYDVAGRRARILLNGAVSSGAHSLIWDGADDSGLPLSGGTYFCRLVTDTGITEGIQLILLR